MVHHRFTICTNGSLSLSARYRLTHYQLFTFRSFSAQCRLTLCPGNVITQMERLISELTPDSLPDMMLLLMHVGMRSMGFSLVDPDISQSWRIDHGAGRMYGLTYLHNAMAPGCMSSIRAVALGPNSVLIVACATDSNGGSNHAALQHVLTVPSTLSPEADAMSTLTWLGTPTYTSLLLVMRLLLAHYQLTESTPHNGLTISCQLKADTVIEFRMSVISY